MAISFVAGSAQFQAASSGTIATPGTLNVQAGDILVAAIRTGVNNNWVNTVDDGGSNVFRFAGQVELDGSNVIFEVFICVNCTANAAATITATYDSAVVNRCINVTQWRGLATISPLDANVRAWVGTADITSPSFDTAVANSVAIAIGMINSTTSTWTVGTGYTEAIRDADDVSITQYQIFSSTQSGITATIQNDEVQTKGIIVISLHEEISGGGGSTTNVSAVLRRQNIIPYRTAYGG